MTRTRVMSLEEEDRLMQAAGCVLRKSADGTEYWDVPNKFYRPSKVAVRVMEEDSPVSSGSGGFHRG